MKKTSVSILILLALIVSGCTSTPKKKKTTSEERNSSQSSENPTSENPTSQAPTSEVAPTSNNPTSTGTSQTSASSSQITPPPSGEFTVTILTAGEELENYTGWSPTGGVAINGQQSGKANLEKLTNWFRQSCGYEGCLSTLECTNIHAQYQLYDNSPHPSLTLGANKSAGTLTWKSSLSITKVEITAKPYYKYVDFTDTWNHDDSTTVLIDTQSFVLETADQITPAQTVSKTYSTPVTSFNLGNTTAGRIYIDQIKITFQN